MSANCPPCTSIPCCDDPLFAYSLVDGLYANPLIPLIFGNTEVTQNDDTGGYTLTLQTLCCEGESPQTVIEIPKLTNSLTIFLNCCDGYVVSRVVEPSMDQTAIAALGVQMVAECIIHLDCPTSNPTCPEGDPTCSDTDTNTGPTEFPVTMTCCDGSQVIRNLRTDMTASEIEAVAQDMADVCSSLLAGCNPEPPVGSQPMSLTPISCAACLFGSYGATITCEDAIDDATWEVVSGFFPPGLVLTGEASVGTIAGSPTAIGSYSFTIQVKSNGRTAARNYFISVIGITTASIPQYYQGVPYSFQLTAAGGSGNYAFEIVDGDLPDGLVLEVDGTIHGTPTEEVTTEVTFGVIDTDCSELNAKFYRPRVSLTGSSITTIATTIGFNEFTPSGTLPPVKYKRLAWSGYSEQTGYVYNYAAFCGKARYDWSGESVMNVDGTFASYYQKLFSAACPTPNSPSSSHWPNIDYAWGLIPSLFGLPAIFKGYCWSPDPNSCSTCSESTLIPVGDVANNSTHDITDLFQLTGTPGTLTPTFLSVKGTNHVNVVLGGVQNFPQNAFFNFSPNSWIDLDSDHDYSATLSDLYTDADALSNAVVFSSNSKTAESFPRTIGYVSQWTTVNFKLHMTNLIAGENYTATVTFRRSDGVTTGQTYNFTAFGPIYEITDAVPTPPDGFSIEVRNPTVVFATP